MQTLQQLLALPEFAPDFGAERLRKLENALAEDRQSDMPWYLRLFVALGAWLASAFFITFLLAITRWNEQHRLSLGITGLVLLITSTILVRLKLGLFINQCCLAACLTGQFMVYYGFVLDQKDTFAIAMALSIGFAATLYWLYPDTLQRVITCVVALQITLAWIYLGNSGESQWSSSNPPEFIVPLVSLYWAFHLAAIACCFLAVKRWPIPLAPLGYAVILSMVVWQLESPSILHSKYEFVSFRSGGRAAIWWLHYIRFTCTALLIFGVVVWAGGGRKSLTRFALPYAGVACALAAIIWVGAGGILLPLLLITLGFLIESSVVLGIGLILLPVFLFWYHHNLSVDLLAKSVAMAGAGLVLVLLRAGLRRWLQLEMKEAE